MARSPSMRYSGLLARRYSCHWVSQFGQQILNRRPATDTKREAPAPAAEQVVRIGAETAFKERRGELGMGLYERPDVDLFGPPTVNVLTGSLTPE